jgi:hypothetical protein
LTIRASFLSGMILHLFPDKGETAFSREFDRAKETDGE